MHTKARIIGILCLMFMVVPQGFAATLSVPGDHATIGAAITAASPGDVVEIVNSADYNESLNITKAITLRAAVGQQPRLLGDGTSSFIIRTGNGAGGAQIGDEDGGTILIGQDPGHTYTSVLEAAHNDTTAVTFENIQSPDELTYSSTGPNIINVTGPGVSVFRHIEANGGGRGVSIRTAAATGANVTVFRGIFRGRYYNEGFRAEAANVTALFQQCEFTSARLQAVVLQADADGTYTFENCWIWHSNNFDLFEIRPTGTPAHVVLYRCLLDQRAASGSVQGSSFKFRAAASSNASAVVDRCDLINAATNNRWGIEIGSGTNRTLTVTNTNIIAPSTTVVGIGDNGTDTNVTVGGNNILTGGDAYVNITPPATDVTPAIDPQYPDREGGNVMYTETSLLTAGLDGGPVGSNWDFNLMVPVELSVFTLN